MKQSTVSKSRGLFFVLGAAVVFLAALPGSAANLVDVRIGLHDEYTRVVLESDAAASCEIESSGSDELVLRLGAGSGEKMVASTRSAHLRWVRVKSAAPGSSRVHIALHGPVAVKKLVLREPDRVVLDPTNYRYPMLHVLLRLIQFNRFRSKDLYRNVCRRQVRCEFNET